MVELPRIQCAIHPIHEVEFRKHQPLRWAIKDHLGSLSLITDEIGAVEQSNYFDPWGRERKIVTSGAIKQWLADSANFRIASKPITTRGFTGHEQLAEVGLMLVWLHYLNITALIGVYKKK